MFFLLAWWWKSMGDIPGLHRWKTGDQRDKYGLYGRISSGQTDKGIEMNTAPGIDESTIEERREYIKNRYPCISDCDMCGLCKVFHGKDPENAYVDYINGKRSFMDVSADYKH